jgi:hypothetical protein
MIGAAAAANSDVQLNCQGSTTANFRFVIGGALTLNANVRLMNGNGLVHWEVDGAVSIAAGFTVDGDIDATGAINILAGAHLNGCARAGGALTLGAGATARCASYLTDTYTQRTEAAPSASDDTTIAYVVGFSVAAIVLTIGIAAFCIYRTKRMVPTLYVSHTPEQNTPETSHV